MKKRLFILLAIVATLMCLFAISASAVAIDGIEYTLNSSAKTATVGNNKTYSASAVVVIPEKVTYNEVEYTVTAVASNAFYNNDNITTLVFPSTVTVLNGYTFSLCSILTSVYIDLDNITYIGTCGLTYNDSTRDSVLIDTVINFYPTAEYGKTEPTRTTSVNWTLTELGSGSLQGLNIENVVIDGTFTTIKDQIFRRSKIVNLTIKNNVQTIGTYSLNNCTSLNSIEIRSNNLTKVQASAFASCSNVTSFKIDLSHLKIAESSSFCFSGSKETVNNTVQWYNLDGEKLVDLSALEQITGTNAFAGSNLGSADTILWPTAYKANTFGHSSDSGAFRRANIRGTVYINAADGYTLNIDRYAFGNENYIETVILGPNVTSAGSAFTDITTLKTVVILADSFDITSSTFISNNASDVKLYYKNLTTNTNFSKSDEIQFADYTLTALGRCGVGVVLTTADGEVVVDKFTHTEGSTNVVDATCTTPEGTAHICKYCNSTISIDETAPALGHSFTILTDIVYARFDADGYKVLGCDRDGCDASDNSTVAPVIFTHKGYSFSEDSSKAGIYSEFSIDTSALQEYEEFYTTTVSFGIAIFNPAYLTAGTTAFFNGEKINAETGIVQVELNENSRKYSRLNCLISGFDKTNASHTALELVIAGFAIEDGKVQIMQKQYEVNAENPVNAPYLSKVTRTDAVLYTVSIGTVEENVAFTSTIKEYTAPTVTE